MAEGPTAGMRCSEVHGHASTSASRTSRLAARLPGWVRPPAGMVDRTRWLFAVLVVVSLALTAPLTLAGSSGAVWVIAMASSVVLGASWIFGYRSRRAPVAMDAIDTVGLVGLSMTSAVAGAVFPVVFAALWFRSQYGSMRRSVVRVGLFITAMAAAASLWTMMPGHSGPVSLGPLVGALPTMLLTVVVGHHLSGAVRGRERVAQLEAVLGSVGSQLLATTEAAAIREIGWGAIERMCEVITGLRVLKVAAEGEQLRTARATASFGSVPPLLPAGLLSLLVCHDSTCHGSIRAHAVLDTATGAACVWSCVPLPVAPDETARAWLLVGAPGGVPAEALVMLENMANQVTLALRNSAVHRDLTVLAEVDSLTGLVNRATFTAALSAELHGGLDRETTVLFVDLDDFKDVNDVHGHHAGDELLRVVATRLREATRPGDLCARIGGDEFAVLLRETGEAAAAQIAQRVVVVVSAPASLDVAMVHVGASVGVATMVGAEDPETLVHRADVAMYSAKAQGKSRVQVYEPGLLHRDPSRVAFERELAAAADNGELVVHYQPVVSLDDGRCTAVEALVRWQHPEQGLLQPDAFIETAERIGAIGAIGTAVLRQAVADASRWRDTYPGCPLAVHVNVSALQLDDDTFALAVADCLREFDWPADRLVLEFTETIVISSAQAISRLNALAASGILIAIDDFGTGYSALTTLRSLPVQIVKIDKSFVAGSTTNVGDLAVIEAIVAMVARMGLRTIAEGVERPEQHDLLLALGVREAQGFLYLRPQPAAQLVGWLGEHLPVIEAAAGRIVIPFAPRHNG